MWGYTVSVPWSPSCGAGWVADDLSGKCYYYSLDAKTWSDARNLCKKMNSDLMSIESKYEQSFLQGMLRADTSGALAYWTGGNDIDSEQGWKWTDRSPFKYFNWNTGEPNSNGDEDCIEVVQLTGQWNDNNCGALRNFICERKNKNAAAIPGAFTSTPLPSSKLIGDSCNTSHT
ncbi:lithostathine-1-like [Watersipora subatra]|uniref:lithostathine-1-like n=1 Tax=Watersipora subatra TaxID=2589382 RepID=UPI00355B3E0C